MFSKKALSPVVSVALFLVVAVVSVIGFQGWFQSFSSSLQVDVETKGDLDSNILRVDALNTNSLYLYSGGNSNLTILKIKNDSGTEMCSFSRFKDTNVSGLVGWWTFDEIINNSGMLIAPDLSGNGNNGTLYDFNATNTDGNTSPQIYPSILGNALYFDGVDDYVDINTVNSESNPDETAIVVIFDKNSSSEGMIYRSNSNTRSYIQILTGASSLSFTKGSPYASSQFSLTQNKNNLAILQWDTNSNSSDYMGYSYYNGELMDTFEFNGSAPSTASYLGVHSPNPIYSFYEGQIDEVRIYNRTLTSQEIQDIEWYAKSQDIPKGTNELDISVCNLISGQKYQIVAFSNSGKVEEYRIVQ